MHARLLQLHPKTYGRLVRLSKEAERDGAYRVAKRLQAVVLNSEGRTSGELALSLIHIWVPDATPGGMHGGVLSKTGFIGENQRPALGSGFFLRLG